MELVFHQELYTSIFFFSLQSVNICKHHPQQQKLTPFNIWLNKNLMLKNIKKLKSHKSVQGWGYQRVHCITHFLITGILSRTLNSVRFLFPPCNFPVVVIVAAESHQYLIHFNLVKNYNSPSYHFTTFILFCSQSWLSML